MRRTLTAVALILVVLGIAAPAGASKQSDYIKALHRAAPATKAFSNAKMVALARGGICSLLSFASSSDVLESLEQSKNNAGATDGYGFPASQAPKILTLAVNDFCPKYKKALKSGEKASATQPAPPTTTAPTAPPLTQQQKSAVAEAKQYLGTQAFSQQGLIDQLDSSDGSGYSVADATVAVDSMTVNWNTEAEQAAKAYLQIQPFSCSDLIQQLDSSAGDQYTVAQATYGAQQAGDCG